MTQEAALQFVYASLLGDDSIPQNLRMKQNLNQPRFDQLVAALRILIDQYADQNTVPKKLALCMVDIYSAFSFRPGFYSEEDSAKIEDAGILLQELATELFS